MRLSDGASHSRNPGRGTDPGLTEQESRAEMRSRLLRMILQNERERKSQAPSQSEPAEKRP